MHHNMRRCTSADSLPAAAIQNGGAVVVSHAEFTNCSGMYGGAVVLSVCVATGNHDHNNAWTKTSVHASAEVYCRIQARHRFVQQ